MRRVSRKAFGIFVDGKLAGKVKSPEDYEKFLAGVDRKSCKVRLK
jgi:hypothetical protein